MLLRVAAARTGPDDPIHARGTCQRAAVAAPSLRGVTAAQDSGEQAELRVVPVDKPDDMNVIVGQAHFIKTIDDLHETLAGVSPYLRFGVAFCEASGPRLVRRSGNDDTLVELATRNALAVGAGHSFFVFLSEGYPVNVLNQLKQVPEVCGIFCATANPVALVVAQTEHGRGIVGVIDGSRPAGVESDTDVDDRRQLLRTIGYKL